MKKTLNIVTGLAAGIMIVIVVNPLLQKMFANLFDGTAGNLFGAISPIIFTIIIIEITLQLTNRLGKDGIHTSFILFQIVLTGYLLFSIFTLVYGVVLKSAGISMLLIALVKAGYSYQHQLIAVLITALVVLSYINLFVKRMKKSLPTVVENKPGKLNDIKK